MWCVDCCSCASQVDVRWMLNVVGFSKESQKIVQLYRSKERYEPSPECEALVNAKYQWVWVPFMATTHRHIIATPVYNMHFYYAIRVFPYRVVCNTTVWILRCLIFLAIKIIWAKFCHIQKYFASYISVTFNSLLYGSLYDAYITHKIILYRTKFSSYYYFLSPCVLGLRTLLVDKQKSIAV